MDQPPRQALDYANLRFHGETAGRLSPWFASAGLILVATSFAIFYFTAGSYQPGLQSLAAYSLLTLPLLCVVGVISGARGLVYPSRYRTRAILGLVLVALDIFAGMMLIGWIATGYR